MTSELRGKKNCGTGGTMASSILRQICKLSLRSCHGGYQLKKQSQRLLHYSGVNLAALSKGEQKLTDILTEKLNPTFIEVRDISGGCGAMYEICIDSELFKGKRIIQQHQLVNQALGDEVKALHGLTIRIGNPNNS